MDPISIYKTILDDLENALKSEDLQRISLSARAENKARQEHDALRGPKGSRSEPAQKLWDEFINRENARENLHKAFKRVIDEWKERED